MAVEDKQKPIIIATNVSFIYDKDPNKFQGAKPMISKTLKKQLTEKIFKVV